VDWGLAKALDGPEAATSAEGPLKPASASASASTLKGSVIGTPAFMSPEQAEGRLDLLGPASDVYSLGATLYCLLTCQPPFSDSDIGVLLQKVQRGDFPRPRQVKATVPAALEAICIKAMTLKLENRYGSPRALADEVEHWLADEPVAVYREPLTQELVRWARHHQVWVASAAALLATAVVALTIGYLLVTREQARTTTAQRDRALSQVEALLEASPRAVPNIIEGLEPFRDWVNPRLRELRKNPDLTEHRRVRASLALLPIDPEQVSYLRERLLEADPEELLVIRVLLAPHHHKLTPDLWALATDPQADPERRFRAALVLAAYDSADPRWAKAGANVVDRFLAANPLHLGLWATALRPVRLFLLAPLAKVFRDPNQGERRQVAANVLADYAEDRPEVLVDLLLDADLRQYAVLWPHVKEFRSELVSLLNQELDIIAPPTLAESGRDALARRQAQAAAALVMLGSEERTWSLLQQGLDPRRRSFLIHLFKPLGIDPRILIRRFQKEKEPWVRRGLLLSLGEYDEAAALVPGLKETLLTIYHKEPDPGMHSAVDWLLRQRWGCGEELRASDKILAGGPIPDRNWFVNSQGQTFAVFRGPVSVRLGSAETELDRNVNELAHSRRIVRTFSLATKKVTVSQFQRFVKEHPEVGHNYTRQYSPEPDCPIISVTWFEAAMYCRWLSELENLPEDQMCFPAIAEIKDGMPLPEDYLSRTGYRLPTEAEWEFAARAGARTSRFFGATEETMSHYAWYLGNARDRTWPVGLLKPNDHGIFDVHGNAWDWCLEPFTPYSAPVEGMLIEDGAHSLALTDIKMHLVRGGAFNTRPVFVRAAYRNCYNRPSSRINTIGLRVARTCR